MQESPPFSESLEIENKPKVYQVGTLQYTFRELVVLFSWLLWGDFAFCFFESIFGRFIPLYLKDYKASNALIGMMMGSIPAGVNLLFLPGISQWCDGYRSRWGRRIPFLAVVAPLTVGAIILMGFAPEIAGVVHRRLIHRIAPGIPLATVVLCCLSIFVVAFHYLNMVLVNAFNWLLRDVVPQASMARFLSFFRIVSTVAGMLFNWYIFPYVISHRKEVCTGIGLFYLVVFLLMCTNVKEGKYPPPPPREENSNLFKSYFVSYWRYLKTCLVVPIYRYSFISSMLLGIAVCSGPFNIFFQRDMLGISLTDLGKLFTVTSGVSAVLCIPMGWIVDRYSPFRISLISGPIGIVLPILSYFFIKDKHTFIFFALLGTVINAPGALATAAIPMELYPAAKFAQFFAATNLFACGVGIFANSLFGAFMDMTHSNYRMIFLWNALWAIPMYIMFIMVYRNWRRYGGPDNYAAPLPPEYTSVLAAAPPFNDSASEQKTLEMAGTSPSAPTSSRE